MTIPQTDRDWLAYQQHRQAGGTDAAFAARLHIKPNNMPRWKKRHQSLAPTLVDVPVDTIDLTPERNGHLPAVSPTVYPEHTAVAPVAPHGIPDLARHSDLEALAQRVEVLEAFIATFQQRGIPVSPNGTPHLTSGIPVAPTTKHSFVIAVDMLDALQHYAAAHHAEIRAVLDVALRTFFAGQEGHADA